MLEQKEPEIHITVSPTGQVDLEVFNVTGPACQVLSKPYADLFNVQSIQYKKEYEQTVRQSERQQQKL